MPLYEYMCGHCEHKFLDVRYIDDRETPAICPKCGGEAKKIMSSGSFQVPKWH